MNLHCVATTEIEGIGLCAIYRKVDSWTNLANYIPRLNARTFTVFETKKKALETVKEWNKDFVKNGLQKKV